MRTKLFLAAIFLVFVFHLQAENVPVEKAIQVATQYYKRLDKVALRSMSTETMSLAYVSEPSVSLRSSAGTTVYFYVFNIGNDNGFIIISGDDRAYPVLGRSSEGSFDPEHLPPAFAQWLQMYREEIADVINRNLDIPTAPGWEDLYENLDINLRAVIEPLCKAKWNQGDPYNRSCPLTDKNERTITGCTATAMAIVMKYHQWPNQAQGSHSYDWSGRRLSVNFDNYDWKNMPNTYSEFGNDIQRAAVAKLMYHCGVSIESTYGTNGTSSSASYIPRALKTYFGYDMKVEYIYKSAYNDLEWKRILKNELDNNRPVVYRGAPPDNSSGHAFVCDGYNDNDEYHMNWGWGGFADGFWRLSTLEPPGYSFNTNQGMVVGIQPAQGNQAFSVLRIFNPGGVTGMTKNVTNVEKNQSFTVNSGAIINESYALFKGLIAVALMSTSGGIKEIVSPSVQQSLDPNYYFTRSFTCKATKDFSNTDILGMVSSTDGGNTWKRIYGGVNTVDFLPVASTVAVTGVSLNTNTQTLTAGGTFQLTPTITPANATNKSVTWTSTNQNVASVNSSGLVTTHNAGTATITVATVDGNKQAICTVTVVAATIPVSGVSLDSLTKMMTVGGTFQLTATIAPSNATNKNVTWTSNNTNVASVNSSGLVTANSAGTATITVATVDGNKRATCTVTVVAATIPVTGVSLSSTARTMTAGENFPLTATVTPSNATNKNVTWVSNNANVASVNSSGSVTAHNVGTATITVATVDGDKRATCTVTVVAATIPVTGVSLSSTAKTMTAGENFPLTATVTPSNATDKSVTWASNNTYVASVNSSGTVTANNAGTATITVTTVNGNKQATCTVTVVAATIPVTGVSLNSTAKTMTAGENFQLTATVTPSNATNKNVTWTSSNANVASINSSGTVTANNAGTATITVTTVDGNRQATCTVTVVAATIPVSGVSLNSTARTMTTGGNFQLTATVTPSNATNKNVTWTSNNANVASVNSSGLVTANSAGTATITVATVDGNKQATCAVTVTSSMVSVTGITLDESSKTMAPGSNFQLTATVTPSNATNKNVTWVSGNPAVATVNSSGLVTANASGTVTIKATTVDGGHSASCQVTVSSACKSPIEGGYSGPITWILCANGTLTISGKGDIPGYIPNRLTHPWFKYRYYFSVVEIEATITGIGICAFYDCANLRTIVIPQNVTKIDYGAFWNCNALPAITIPKKVQYIGDEAFYNNANLRNVTVYWTTAGELPTLGNNVFKSLPADATLHVPVGTKGIYSSAPVWKNFNIVDDVVVLTSGDLGEFDSVFEIENITGIRNDNTDVPEARIFNQKLYVNSPVSETVAIYSINGTILFTAPKNTGQETYNVTNLPKGVYIVKGSSGWVKKVLKTE